METILNTNKYEAASVDFAELFYLFGFSDFILFSKQSQIRMFFFWCYCFFQSCSYHKNLFCALLDKKNQNNKVKSNFSQKINSFNCLNSILPYQHDFEIYFKLSEFWPFDRNLISLNSKLFIIIGKSLLYWLKITLQLHLFEQLSKNYTKQLFFLKYYVFYISLPNYQIKFFSLENFSFNFCLWILGLLFELQVLNFLITLTCKIR